MSKSSSPARPFFVGYGNRLPKGIASLIFPVFAVFISGAIALSLLLSSSQSDPGSARFRFDLGYQKITGILEMHPYPVLRLPPQNGEPAKTLMLSGQGKRGVLKKSSGLSGRVVDAGGIFLKRGDISMLQIGGKVGLKASEKTLPGGFLPKLSKPLGKWRLTGEICDGKCTTGAMRPGRGLAHKACANLCISGGIPPVLVSTGPVNGNTFFLLADKDGKPLGDKLYDLTALMIEAEGEVEQLDDMMVFKMDTTTVKVLQ